MTLFENTTIVDLWVHKVRTEIQGILTTGGVKNMEIVIKDAALKWFKDEMGLQKGDKVKFYSKIYGSSPVQESYSLGFTKDNEPIDLAVNTEVDGIVFYVEGTDLWYFNGHDLHVDYNEKIDELQFNYIKP